MLRNCNGQDFILWGKSIHGGYYATTSDKTYYNEGKLGRLCAVIGLSTTALRRDVLRMDNIDVYRDKLVIGK